MSVKVTIYDQTYAVAGDLEPVYVEELAQYVDSKMREIARGTNLVDSVKVAVLAALNVADEMFTTRKRQEALEGPLRERVQNCVSMVEKALEQAN